MGLIVRCQNCPHIKWVHDARSCVGSGGTCECVGWVEGAPEPFAADCDVPVAPPRDWCRPGHKRFYALLDEMANIHASKNSDYADSGIDPLANFRECAKAGISAVDGCHTRMSDKWMRVTNLHRKRREGRAVGVPDESIKDTLIDLANYCLIQIILLEETS